MRSWPLSRRLTLAAALAVLLAVAVLGASAVYLVDRQLRGSLDTALRGRGVDVARLSVSVPALLEAPGALESPASGRQLVVEVLDRRGAILARSLALGAKLLPRPPAAIAAARAGRATFSDVSLGDTPLRLYAAPVAEVGGAASGGVVLVAASTADVDRTVERLGRLLALCALASAGVGAAGASVLTRRGLRPLRRLSAAAASIQRSGDPGERLPEPPAGDEVGELAGTLNAMLAALEDSRRRERRFLADASHELRTPLTALIGNVEYLARHGAGEEVLADLQADTARLRALVDDLLTLERQGEARAARERVVLGAVVAEAVAGRERVDVAAGPAQVAVLGDRGALRRALDNLLDNAAVHGPPGGRIWVEVGLESGWAELSVADAGPGLPPEQAARAFERFWRGPDAAGRAGTGLGLAIVRAVADRHAGTVAMDGSRVTLRLPAAA